MLNELREQGGSPSHSKAPESHKGHAPFLLTDTSNTHASAFINYSQLYEDLHRDIEAFVKEHEEYSAKTSHLFKQLIDEIKRTIKVKYPKAEVRLADKGIRLARDGPVDALERHRSCDREQQHQPG